MPLPMILVWTKVDMQSLLCTLRTLHCTAIRYQRPVDEMDNPVDHVESFHVMARQHRTAPTMEDRPSSKDSLYQNPYTYFLSLKDFLGLRRRPKPIPPSYNTTQSITPHPLPPKPGPPIARPMSVTFRRGNPKKPVDRVHPESQPYE